MLKQKIHKVVFVIKDEGLPGLAGKVKKKTRNFHKAIIRDTTVDRPESFMIEMTNRCNLKCITCAREYEYGDKMDKGSIDLDKFKKVIDEIAPYAKTIGLTGLGETLLYKRLPEAAEYIHAKIDNPDIFISTNANLPNTPALLEALVGKVSTVQISIDGVFDVYNEIRLRGDYEIFIENVRLIAKIPGPEFIFNMVVTKHNYKHLSKVIEVADDVGIKKAQFNTFNLASLPSHDINDYRLYESEQFLNEYNKVVELAIKLGIEFVSFFDFDRKPGFKKCLYPWAGFYITWDGYLVPCCAKPFPLELNFGNVFDEGVLKCINSEKYRQFRKEWYRNRTPAFCENCHLIKIHKVDVGCVSH